MSNTDANTEPDYLALKVGDNWRGEHIDVIYHATADFLVYSSVEKPDKIHFDYLKDAQRAYLDQLEPGLSELKGLLQDHPQRSKFLSSVAAIYATALDGKPELAGKQQQALIEKIKAADTSGKDLNKPAIKLYLTIAIVSFLVAAGSVYYYILLLKEDPNLPNSQLFYLILIVFGISFSALLFGVMNSYGSLQGKESNTTYKFTGPIVGVILTVLGGFYLPGKSPSPFPLSPLRTLTIRVFDSMSNPIGRGDIKLYITNFNIAPEKIGPDGQVIFANIPADALMHPIKIYITSPGYEKIMKDTLVAAAQTIEFKMEGAGVIRVSGKVKDAKESPVKNARVFVEGTMDSAAAASDGSYYLSLKGNQLDSHIKIKAFAPGFDEKTIAELIDKESEVLDITLNSSSIADKSPGKGRQNTNRAEKIVPDKRVLDLLNSDNLHPAELYSLCVEIGQKIGLKINFSLLDKSQVMALWHDFNYAASIYAFERDGKRFVYYDFDSLYSLRARAGTPWALLAILAHECAHHYLLQDLKTATERRTAELDANEFGGFILERFGVTWPDTKALYKRMDYPGSAAGGPDRQQRLSAVSRGWHRAELRSAN